MQNKIKCIAVVPIWVAPNKPCKLGDIIELTEKDYNRKFKNGTVKPLPEPEKPKPEQAKTQRKMGTRKNARSKKN